MKLILTAIAVLVFGYALAEFAPKVMPAVDEVINIATLGAIAFFAIFLPVAYLWDKAAKPSKQNNEDK